MYIHITYNITYIYIHTYIYSHFLKQLQRFMPDCPRLDPTTPRCVPSPRQAVDPTECTDQDLYKAWLKMFKTRWDNEPDEPDEPFGPPVFQSLLFRTVSCSDLVQILVTQDQQKSAVKTFRTRIACPTCLPLL